LTEVTELTFMENSDNSRDSFLHSSWDHDSFRTQAAIQAHPGMDLQHVLSDGGGAAVSDQPSLALQASRYMLQCQQLQWECLQANCGLSPAVSDWLVDSCRALPVNEQLHLLNEQIEVLRQRLKRSMCPATADPSA
jgi:hypothetical protein